MTKPTYRAGTPSARRRAQKAADTRAAKARAHERELAARRERDRARREEKRQAEARARWERERRLAERRERAAFKAAPAKKKAAPAKKKAAPAKKKAAPAKKKAAPAKKKAAPAKKKAAPSKKKAAPAKKKAAPSKKKAAPRKPTRAELLKRQRSAAARKGWDTRRRRAELRTRWEQFAFEAQERAQTPVEYEEAIRAGVDPLDPTVATGWQLLTVYVKSTRREDFNERLAEYLDVVDAWLATGLLPPSAYELPVDKWETTEFTGSGARALGKLFEADSTSTAGLRCVPSLAPSDESRFEVWKSSNYVRREKRRNKQRAAKRRRGE